MTKAHTSEVRFDNCTRSGHAATPGTAGWLGLAAAPTFAVMALVSAIHGNGSFDAFCSAMHGSSPLTGMAAMYALMSLFHAGPWLRRIGGVR
jgi:hypothetical protein